VLENGVYSATQPIPSSITSTGVLMAENELFDRVFVSETIKDTKSNTKSLSIKASNGSIPDSVEANGHHDHYHRKNSSSAVLDSAEDSPTFCSKTTKKYICNFIVMASLVVVVCLYSLGIVFFYTDIPKNDGFDTDATRNNLTIQLEQCAKLVSFVYNIM